MDAFLGRIENIIGGAIITLIALLLMTWIEGRERRASRPAWKYWDRVRIWESGDGRSDGWDVELAGRVVAIMTDPQWAEMFWESWHITPTTADPLAVKLASEEFWESWKSEDWMNLKFRSRATGFFADGPFPAGTPMAGPQRVIMRGLYIYAGDREIWDWPAILFYRLFRRVRRVSGWKK